MTAGKKLPRLALSQRLLKREYSRLSRAVSLSEKDWKMNNSEEMNITDVVIQDVDDEEDVVSKEEIEDVALEMEEGDEDQQNVVTNDLEYIAKFADLPEIARNIELPMEETMVEEESSGSEEEPDSEVENNDEVAQENEESDSESSASSLDENFKKNKSKITSWLTEEEEDGAATDGPPKTKHEIDAEELEKQQPQETPDYPLKIENLKLLARVGYVMYQIPSEHSIVIQADHTLTPLNESSLIANVEGMVLGRVSEIFGPVTTPFYIVRYRIPAPKQSKTIPNNNEEESTAPASSEVNSEDQKSLPDHFSQGTVVFTTPSHATFMTANIISTLKIKGSDASNAFDEEVRFFFFCFG
jgi:rRNA processing protein Gar1/rRNA maturation endonuclease Nob1